MPFEYSGAISISKIELPTEVRQFDYNTITVIVVHVKYKAREGGSDLKDGANAVLCNQLEAIVQSLGESGLHIAVNLKHDLQNEWLLLKETGIADLVIDKVRLPYVAQTIIFKIENVMFVAKTKDNSPPPPTFTINLGGAVTDFIWLDELKLYTGITPNIHLDISFTISVSDAEKVK